MLNIYINELNLKLKYLIIKYTFNNCIILNFHFVWSTFIRYKLRNNSIKYRSFLVNYFKMIILSIINFSMIYRYFVIIL